MLMRGEALVAAPKIICVKRKIFVESRLISRESKS
jgi:hypothetical protein